MDQFTMVRLAKTVLSLISGLLDTAKVDPFL